MDDLDFANKFNNLKIDSFSSADISVDLLVEIHKYIFSENQKIAGHLRNCCNTKLLSKILSNMQLIDFESNIFEVSKNISRYISQIFMLQPFEDGNCRVTITFLKIFILSKNRKFNFVIQNNYEYKKFIEIIYSKNDRISNKTIKLLKKNISRESKR